jgi:hypothetical protein
VEIASVHPPDPDRTNQLLYPRGDTNYNSGGCGETLWGGHTTNVVWTNFGQPGD